MSLREFFDRYPDDEAAEEFFTAAIWPSGPYCPRCGGDRVYEPGGTSPLPYRCRPCRRAFSVKSNTVMRGSRLGYQTWLLALYLMITDVRGVSSMKLHRDLNVRQHHAWHLAHRIRKAWEPDGTPLPGNVVEADETMIGPQRRSMHRSKRPSKLEHLRQKIVVAGVKDRETGQVRAEVVSGRRRSDLVPFINRNVLEGTNLYTDDHGAYHGIEGYEHDTVVHSAGEYVRGDVHTQGIESFWNALKWGYGSYRRWSHKHARRYVAEFEGRNNLRHENTLVQLVLLARAMVGKRLRWKDLTAN